MQTKAQSIEAYLSGLPEERRTAMEAVRATILANLPKGYEEVFQYGMISYVVPLSRFPHTYNGQPLAYVSVASQKNYLSIYLMGVYGDEAHGEWFRTEYQKTGKKLDMGKSCVRFKKPSEIPLELIGRAVALLSVDEFLSMYERAKAR